MSKLGDRDSAAIREKSCLAAENRAGPKLCHERTRPYVGVGKANKKVVQQVPSRTAVPVVFCLV